ncbi:MAG TPA: acyl-CoA dehydrogenase family protein, partial [Gaiellales bacterium]|nr:acyl-CoA dehydrogenase family protein [Gaiellales bacterium]
MDFALTPGQRELRARAAAFVDEVLIPLELTAELAGGRLPEADRRHVRDQARERGLDSGNHPVELGGRGWDNVEQVLVQEELGRNTNAIWWNMAGGYNVLSSGTPEQIERYLRPTLRGERADAYAVTEGGAGSDAGAIAGTAVETAGGWHLSSEKWFVTTGDVADYFIVMANVLRDGELLPALFLVDRDRPGIEVVD